MIARLAPPDVDLRACAAEAHWWHVLYREHVEIVCRDACMTGGLCEGGRRLLLEADDADRRVELAKRRVSGGRR